MEEVLEYVPQINKWLIEHSMLNGKSFNSARGRLQADFPSENSGNKFIKCNANFHVDKVNIKVF